MIKAELDKVAYSVRATQAVRQYGAGAMVDFSSQVLTTSNPEEWDNPKRLYDERFAKSLGVKWFIEPTSVSYSRFPEWYFCPKCRTFKPLLHWINDHKNKNPNNDSPNMKNRPKCSSCNLGLVPARIMAVCENGHLDDFPWLEWVHAQNNKKVCSERATLKLMTSPTGSEGLEGLFVKCNGCGASSTLKGIFNKDCFEKMNEKTGGSSFVCTGRHPFKRTREKCHLFPKAILRGSSSIYFPLVYSSLVIPPYSSKLRAKIEQSDTYDWCERTLLEELEDVSNDEKRAYITSRIDKWSEKIAKEINADAAEVKAILNKKWLEDGSENEQPADSIQYKYEEYEALTGRASSVDDSDSDFIRTGMNINEYNIPFLKAVSLIEKIRIVTAFVGFSRINPVSSMADKGFVNIKEPSTPYYPANEVHGEGIFIELDNDAIDGWLKNNATVQERAALLTKHYSKSFEGSEHPKIITPKFVMLHTLSHILIKQLSFECGYNIASLSERVYCSEKTDGIEMSGIFIYTSSGDSEGTLGGLVRQGRPDALPNIIKRAISNIRYCSNDPICTLSHGQGRESLNLAACHACALLPETCCEEKNTFLDRVMLIGSYTNPDCGFASNLDGYKTSGQVAEPDKTGEDSFFAGWLKSRQKQQPNSNTPSSNTQQPPKKADIKYVEGEAFKNDYNNWQEASIIVESLNLNDFDASAVPLPNKYGGYFQLENGRIDNLFIWPDKKVAILDIDKLSDIVSDTFKNEGWNVFDSKSVTPAKIKALLES